MVSHEEDKTMMTWTSRGWWMVLAVGLLAVGVCAFAPATGYAQPADQPEAPGQPAAQPPAEPQPPSPEEEADIQAAAQAALNEDVELRELEYRVNRLKEEILKSKRNLLNLQQTILSGPIAQARVKIVHHNDLGGFFKLESVVYFLDGSRLFRKVDNGGDLDGQKTIVLYDGMMQPGDHLISVMMTYRGTSGFFNYVEGLQVQLKSSHNFEVQDGMQTLVDIYGYDKGGWLADLKDRPGIYAKTSANRLTAEDLARLGAEQGEVPQEGAEGQGGAANPQPQPEE